jgi:hypothetical protein
MSDYLQEVPPSLSFIDNENTRQLDAAFESAERAVADRTSDLLEALNAFSPDAVTLPEARAVFAAMRATVDAQLEADRREHALLVGIVQAIDEQIAAATTKEAIPA